jgi:hypothetical protein
MLFDLEIFLDKISIQHYISCLGMHEATICGPHARLLIPRGKEVYGREKESKTQGKEKEVSKFDHQ